jgi:hypothetical protein
MQSNALKSIETSERCIHNCFRHAGILSEQRVNVTENEDDIEVEATTTAAAAADDDDNLPLSEWVRKTGCDVLGTMSMMHMQQKTMTLL